MPRLRVLAGPSPTSLSPIAANDGHGHPIKSSSFEGEISVFLKDFVNEKGEVPHTSYFDEEGRKGCTWSIQARGAFFYCKFELGVGNDEGKIYTSNS